jgi:hypothetical protein
MWAFSSEFFCVCSARTAAGDLAHFSSTRALLMRSKAKASNAQIAVKLTLTRKTEHTNITCDTFLCIC